MDSFGLATNTARRPAQYNRDAALARNAYARFLGQQRGARQLVDVDRRGTRGLEGLAVNLSRRGVVNSGIARTAQNDYAEGWMSQRQNIYDQLAALANQQATDDANAWNQYQMTDADLQAQKANDILSTASQLQEFRPFLGS